MGKPVKLMWHRADDARVGPRAPDGHLPGPGHRRSASEVLAFNQSLTCVETDFRHGLGEIITARAADLPAGLGNLGFAETIFALTQEVPYDFGAVTQTLIETDDRLQHRLHAQHLLARRPRAPASSSSTSSPRRWAWTPTRSGASSCATTAAAGRARQGRRGRASGAGRCRPGTAQGIAHPQGVQGRRRRAWSRSTAARRPHRHDPRRRSPARGSPRSTYAVDVGLRDQPARPRGPDAGRHQRRHRPRADLEPAPARRALPRGQLGQLLLHAAVEHPARASRCIVMPSTASSPVAPARRASPRPSRRWPAPTPGPPGTMPTYFPINHEEPLGFDAKPFVPPSRSRPPTASTMTSEETPMPRQTFILNGKPVTVDVADDVRLLWVLRDVARRHRPEVRLRHQRLQGLHQPHQRQGVQPVLGAGRGIEPDRRGHHDRGPARHRRRGPAPDAGGVAGPRRRPVRLLPARPDHGRGGAGQAGPGEGREITEADLDGIRNICRCGTYTPHPRGHRGRRQDM